MMRTVALASTLEAVFDAEPSADATRTIVVRLGDREIARVPVDFSRID
jgi:hypothetical protein